MAYTWKGAGKESSCRFSYKMATMVQLSRQHIVEACNEAESMAEELSGRLAEQDIVNPIDLGFLCQSGCSVPSYLVQMCANVRNLPSCCGTARYVARWIHIVVGISLVFLEYVP